MTRHSRITHILALIAALLLIGTAYAQTTKKKTLGHEGRPRPRGARPVTTNLPPDVDEPRHLDPDHRYLDESDWNEARSMGNDDSWYPYATKPPFGVDHGSDKAWMIQAGAARIDARPGRAPVAIPSELKISEPMGTRTAYYIVHFKGKIQTEWKDRVAAAGAKNTTSYLPNNALVMQLTPAAYQALSAVPEVDWIGYYEPAYKISPLIGRLPVPADRVAGTPTVLNLALFGGVDPESVAPRLRAMGLNLLTDIAAAKAEKFAPRPWHNWILSVEAERAKALDIAAIDEVQYIEEAATVKDFRAFSAGGIMQSGDNAPWGALGSNDPNTSATFFPLWGEGLQGQGQIVGVADSGVDYGLTGDLFDAPVSPALTSGCAPFTGTNCFDTGNTKVPLASLRDGSSDPCDSNGGHGTGVTGSCCQDWHANSTTESRESNQAGRGEFGEAIAHEAQVVVAPFNWSFFTPGSQRLQWLDLAAFGASVMNTSVVWLTNPIPATTYDSQSWVYDSVIDTAESLGNHMLITNAAGNDGTCGVWDTGSDTAGWAKNALDVGASDDLSRFDRMYTTGFRSNKGPDWTNPPGAASNDLIFPDVLSIAGDSTQSSTNATITAFADGTCNNADGSIQAFGGTSGAAPTVAGAVALVHQYFEEGNYPPIADPSAALLKAMVINSGDLMNSSFTCAGRGVPSGEQGWGRVNLSDVLPFGGSSFALNAFDVNNAGGFSASGQIDTHTINITNTGQPLRVTLVWTDEPASIGSNRPYLVNDLNLEVEKGGTTYYGNNFDPSTGLSITSTTAADGANVVENVWLSAAQVAALGTGNLTVRVEMANAPNSRNQGYAIVVTGGISPPTQVVFDKPSYGCGDSITVTAFDDTPTLSATITSSTDSETVALSSVGGTAYQNLVPVATAIGDTTNNNGTLGVTDGETITVTYETIHTDNAAINCSMDISTSSVVYGGGCDVWDPTDYFNNTDEKWRPYPDTGELAVLTYRFTNIGQTDVTNVLATISDTAGCMTFYGSNPRNLGTVPAGTTAGASWTVDVGSCPNLTSSTIELSVIGDTFPVATTLSDVTTTVNADDVITQHSACFDHSSADMTSLAWGSIASGDVDWQRSASPTCDSEDRTDGTCADSGTGMYKQGFCGVGSPPSNSAGTIVPVSPISLVNSGSVSGQAYRYGLTRASFYAATSTTDEDELFWGLFADDQHTSASQIADGVDVLDWPFGVAFFPMSTLDCCGGTPSSWDWDSGNGGTPGASTLFCGLPGTAPDNQTTICFGSETSGVFEAGEIGTPGTNFINIGITAVEEQLFGLPSGGGTNGFGVDNFNVDWEEFYAGNEIDGCAAGQCGQIAFDLTTYRTGCGEVATITVIDGNAGPAALTVTVTSASGGDSEDVTLVKQGSDPVYVGTIALSTADGLATNDGTLRVLPTDTLDVTYNDADDGTATPCSDSATAATAYPSGELTILGRPVQTDGNDNDGHADTNETMTFSVELQNDETFDLTNVVATIETLSPEVTCIINDTANFGTIGAGNSKENPVSERYSFQVSSTYECSDGMNPDTAAFIVHVTADQICGKSSPLSTTFFLDVDDPGPVAPPLLASYGDNGPTTRPLTDHQPDSIIDTSAPLAGRALRGKPLAVELVDPAEPGFSPVEPSRLRTSSVDPAQGKTELSRVVTDLTRGDPPTPPKSQRAVCGNSRYDDEVPETAEWFGGGEAGNPDCMMGILFDPADFGLLTDYTIDSVCFGNEINFGGPWPNRWRIHPDNAGVPDDSTTLETGVVSTGDGLTGQEEFTFGSPIMMNAGEKFWVLVRGDNTGCCTSEDFNVEVDQSTTAVQSFRNDCDGLSGFTTAASGEYTIHTTLTQAASFTCDTTDNSGLAQSCAPEISGASGVQLEASRNGTSTTLVDLEFDDVGSLDYNIYVSTLKETLASMPFDVESPDGKRSCSVATTDIGARRTVTAYNVDAGLGASNVHFILVGYDTGVHVGSLGQHSAGERHATSYCP